MNIVIAGAGEIGSNLAIRLREEGHSISIIERDPEVMRRMEKYDVFTVTGSASDPVRLKEANIAEADIFIAVTGSDEANLNGCALSKFRIIRHDLAETGEDGTDQVKCLKGIRLNHRITTFARVNDADLLDDPIDTDKFLCSGADVAFCPDQMVAKYLSNLLLTFSLFNLKLITDTGLNVVEAEISDSSPVAGLTFKDISSSFDHANIVLIFRRSEVIVPHEGTQFLPGDRVQILVLRTDRIENLEKYFGRGLKQLSREDTTKRVIILGATRVGIKLAVLLKTDRRQRRHITLIEKNPERVEEANRIFTRLRVNVNVIKGLGSDVNLLRDNRIGKADAFVAATRKEQTNIIACLLAKKLGAARTIAIIESEVYQPLLETMFIDNVVNIKLFAVSTIFPHIISKERMESLSFIGGDASAVEFKIRKKSPLDGRQFGKVSFPAGVKVGALFRDKKALIPDKAFELRSGDRLIIFGKGNFITDLSRLF